MSRICYFLGIAIYMYFRVLNQTLLLKNWEIAKMEGDLIQVPPLE